MPLQDLYKKENREELCVIMPLGKEYEELAQEGSNHKLNSDGTLTLKDQLIMKVGTHNEVYYSLDELKESYMTGEGAGLFYDHEESVKNYAGLVKNLRLEEKTGEVFGDIHVTNKQAALDISLGAKWGVSPTIEAEKILVDGEQHAKESLFLSYSLVLRPAVRETMLNSEKDDIHIVKRRSNKLENNERELQMLAEKDSKIQKLEKEKKDLEEKSEKDKQKLEEAEKKIEESEKGESDKDSEELCELECSIGFTSEVDKNSRLEELKSLSAETRSALKSAHEKYVKTLKLGEGEPEEDPKKDPSEEPKLNEELNSKNPQVRMRAELAEEANRKSKIGKDIFDYMKEQEKK